MIENLFLIVLAFVWLAIASLEDIKRREVANWLSFSLIIFAFAYRIFYSVFSKNVWFFLNGLIGFGVFFILANVFYYSHVFAGGDAKILMGLGLVLPFSSNLVANFSVFVFFVFSMLFVGSFYGLFYSFVLVIRNRDKFPGEFNFQIEKMKSIFLVAGLASLVFLFLGIFLDSVFLFLFLLILAFPLLYSYAKAVEESCFIKKVDVEKLTEGDLLYEPMKLKSGKIIPRWDGLSKKEIMILRKSKRSVLIKDGIPFIPIILASFILALWYFHWNFVNLLGFFP